MATGRAADDVRAAIEHAGGAVPFSTFVELALYGPHGFYTDPAGSGTYVRRASNRARSAARRTGRRT